MSDDDDDNARRSVAPGPPAGSPPGIARSGFLEKRSGTRGDKYQKRFFVLHGRYLSYFKDASDSLPAGCIDLGEAAIEVPDGNDRRPYEIRLGTKAKTYHLVANGRDSAAQWVAWLTGAIGAHRGRAPDPLPTSRTPAWHHLARATHRGTIWKQGGARPTWHERFGALVGGADPHLFYFRDVPEGHAINCLGSIPLLGAYLLPNTTAAVDRPFAFAVMTRARQYLLVATSAVDRDAWCQGILKCIADAERRRSSTAPGTQK